MKPGSLPKQKLTFPPLCPKKHTPVPLTPPTTVLENPENRLITVINSTKRIQENITQSLADTANSLILEGIGLFYGALFRNTLIK